MPAFDSNKSKLLVDQYDLSAFLNEVSGFPGPRTLVEVTTLNDAGAKFVPSLEAISPQLTGFFFDDVLGIDDALGPLRTSVNEQVVSYAPQGFATQAKRLYTCQARLSTVEIGSSVGRAVEEIASFSGGLVDHGTILQVNTTITATTNGASIDGAASSSNGAVWVIHVLAVTATGGNAQWLLSFQDSADDASFADVSPLTLTVATATPVGSRLTTASGATIRRHVRSRAVLDATSGSITYLSAFVRG